MSKCSQNVTPQLFDPGGLEQGGTKQLHVLVNQPAREPAAGQSRSKHSELKNKRQDDTRSIESGFGTLVLDDSHSLEIPHDQRLDSHNLEIPPNQMLDNQSLSDSSLSSYSLTSLTSDDLKSVVSKDSAISVSSENSEKLRDYASKMGYSDDTIQKAFDKLNESRTALDSNSLLQCMIELHGKSQPNPVVGHQKPVSTALKADSTGSELRKIVIDGSNVAMEHGAGRKYSCKGIAIVVEWFKKRGHNEITVFVPAHRFQTGQKQVTDQYILKELRNSGIAVKVPGRKVRDKNVNCHDDRFILKLAADENAIVVSNDHFRDLHKETELAETIEKRVLPYTFVNDRFLPAEDPQGRKGLTLDQFLRVNPLNPGGGICPYGRKCTYGNKCKYLHPERKSYHDSSIDTDTPVVMRQHSMSRPQSEVSDIKGEVNVEHRQFNVDRPQSLPPHLSIMPDAINRSMGKTHGLPTQFYNSHNQTPFSHSAVAYGQRQRVNNQPMHHTSQQYNNTPPIDFYRAPSTSDYFLSGGFPTPPHPMVASQSNVGVLNHQEVYCSLPIDGQLSSGQAQTMPANYIHRVASDHSFIHPKTPFCDFKPQHKSSTPAMKTRQNLYDQLVKTFNPDLVKKVMEQHPEETNYKQLVVYLVSGITSEQFSV